MQVVDDEAKHLGRKPCLRHVLNAALQSSELLHIFLLPRIKHSKESQGRLKRHRKPRRTPDASLNTRYPHTHHQDHFLVA